MARLLELTADRPALEAALGREQLKLADWKAVEMHGKAAMAVRAICWPLPVSLRIFLKETHARSSSTQQCCSTSTTQHLTNLHRQREGFSKNRRRDTETHIPPMWQHGASPPAWHAAQTWLAVKGVAARHEGADRQGQRHREIDGSMGSG